MASVRHWPGRVALEALSIVKEAASANLVSLPRRRALRQIRQRANSLACASYANYLATLIEIYEAHGLEAALSWDVSSNANRLQR